MLVESFPKTGQKLLRFMYSNELLSFSMLRKALVWGKIRRSVTRDVVENLHKQLINFTAIPSKLDEIPDPGNIISRIAVTYFNFVNAYKCRNAVFSHTLKHE